MSSLKERLSFFMSCLVFYWSLPLTLAFGDWSYSPKCRNDIFSWTSFMMRFFKVRLYRIGERECYRKSTCVWLCNHREWADFFVDLYVTEGRSGFLSRLMVLIVFPVFGIYGVLSKTAVFFRRNSKGRDFSKFNQMITQQIQRGPCSGIVVYPEGTRNIKPEALPLKRGMVRYAYTEKFPIQVVITTNKEHILSQKMKKASFGTRCLVGYSDIVDPSEYSNFEAFFEKVKSTWDSEWKRVYTADIADAVEITDSVMRMNTPFYSVSFIRFLQMNVYAYCTLILMIGVVAFSIVLAERTLHVKMLHFGGFGKDCFVLGLIIAFSVAGSKMLTRKQD